MHPGPIIRLILLVLALALPAHAQTPPGADIALPPLTGPTTPLVEPRSDMRPPCNALASIRCAPGRMRLPNTSRSTLHRMDVSRETAL